MSYIGIVGHEEKKFNADSKWVAVELIRTLLSDGDILVSGGCQLRGIDIWAEEVADEMGIEKVIFYPQRRSWHGGYKQRNLLIAQKSDITSRNLGEKMPDLLIQEHEIDDFINDLTNSIQEGVVPEIEVTHFKGDIFEGVNDDIVIPSDDLKDVIREVIERWIEEGLALT